jgi:hypothetical protein
VKRPAFGTLVAFATLVFAASFATAATIRIPPPEFVELVSVSSGGTLRNNDSRTAALDVDGRFVAFASLASNLVAGDTNDAFDVFVRDRRERGPGLGGIVRVPAERRRPLRRLRQLQRRPRGRRGAAAS